MGTLPSLWSASRFARTWTGQLARCALGLVCSGIAPPPGRPGVDGSALNSAAFPLSGWPAPSSGGLAPGCPR